MTKTGKRKTIKILCVIASAFLMLAATAFAGCGKKQIEFKETDIKYMVGDNIDCFSFVERIDGYDFKFAIQKQNADTTQDVNGRTFVVHESGDYVLHCTATKEKKVITGDTVITVYDTPPVAIVPNQDLTVELYSELPLYALVNMNGNVFLLSDSKTMTVIESGTYFENETDTEGDTVEFYDTTLPMESFNLVEYRKKTIYFDKEGIWYFNVYVQNQGGVSKGKFRVFVSEALEELEDITEQANATFNESTLQAKWDAVEGAAGYRAKVRTYVVSTDKTSADMSGAYYPPFEFFDFVIIPYDADGKNIGKKMVIENCVVSPKGYEGVVLNEKVTLDQSTRVATLDGANVASGQWWASLNGTVDKSQKSGAAADPINGYVGIKGNFGVGYYIEMEFGASSEDVGQVNTDFGSCNMPQIILFADEINGNKTNTGGKGILLSSGLGAWAENSVHEALTSTMDYFSVHGTERATYISAKTTLPTIVKTDEYPLLTQNGMKAQGGGKTYKYIVGTKYSDWGTVLIDVTLLVKQGNDYIEIKTAEGKSYTNILLDTWLTKADIEELGTNIILTAENKYKVFAPTTTFSFKLPEFKGAGNENSSVKAVVNEKIVSNEAGTITLKGANISQQKWWSCLDGSVDTSAVKGADPVNGYVGLKGNFGVGYYIETEFGASTELVDGVETDFGSCNMPQIILFADEINGNKTNTGGKGILLSSGLGAWWENSTFAGLTETMDYFGVHGPNRATYPGNAAKSLQTLAKTSEYPLLTQNGMKAQGGGKTYKYIVGTKYSDWGRLLIDVTLLVKEGDDYVEIKTAEGKSYNNVLLDTGLTKTDVNALGTNIILTAENKYKVFAPTTTFSFKLPEFKGAGNTNAPKTKSSGATFNPANGSLSITSKSAAGYASTSAGRWATYYNYFAIEGDYGVGTYMDFKFKGINMPQLILFADSPDSDTAYQSITNYGSGTNTNNEVEQNRKGVVILNGLIEKGDYLQIFGPNRMSGSNKYGETGNGELLTLSKDNYLELTRTGQKANLNKNYALTIGTFVGTDGKVWIDILLKDGDTGATIHEVKQSLNLTAQEVGYGDIIILPPLGNDGEYIVDGKGGTTCTIDYISLPYQKDNA